MKKLLFIFLIVLFVLPSCMTLEELKVIQSEESFQGIDFRPYTEKGFFMTPEKYDGEYEPIGIVTYKLMPAAQYIKSGIKENPMYKPGQGGQMYISTYSWDIDKIHLKDALDGIYEKCLFMGADALVNVELKAVRKEYTGIKNPTVIMGYEISGFAIKRK